MKGVVSSAGLTQRGMQALVANDSTLTIRTRWGIDWNLQPVWDDVFGGAYVVRFTRKGGKIDGFLVSRGRVRGVRFERIGPRP